MTYLIKYIGCKNNQCLKECLPLHLLHELNTSIDTCLFCLEQEVMNLSAMTQLMLDIKWCPNPSQHNLVYCWQYKTVKLLYTWTLCKRIQMSCSICEQHVKVTSKVLNAIWSCHQNQLCFVHIFLILVCCTIATRNEKFIQGMWWRNAQTITHSHSSEDYQLISMVYQFCITIDSIKTI